MAHASLPLSCRPRGQLPPVMFDAITCSTGGLAGSGARRLTGSTFGTVASQTGALARAAWTLLTSSCGQYIFIYTAAPCATCGGD